MRPVDEAKPINPRRRTSTTELHWIPRAGSSPTTAGLHEWAVVDRDLGDRDWASIDPMRVRKSKGVRHQFTPAMYYWQRTRSHVWCESQQERWEVRWLDYGGQVELLWAQPLAIAFGHGSRLLGESHVPDFLAQFTDGSPGLLDVRPAELVTDHARVQFEETANLRRAGLALQGARGSRQSCDEQSGLPVGIAPRPVPAHTRDGTTDLGGGRRRSHSWRTLPHSLPRLPASGMRMGGLHGLAPLTRRRPGRGLQQRDRLHNG